MTNGRKTLVKLAISHGDYRQDFYGSGDDILEAAADAAIQTTYGSGLFDITDNFYARRASYRDELAAKLARGEEYRGFGWCTFSRVA